MFQDEKAANGCNNSARPTVISTVETLRLVEVRNVWGEHWWRNV